MVRMRPAPTPLPYLSYLTVHYSLPSTLCMDDPCRRCCELLPKSAVSSSWMRQVPLWY